MGLLESKVALVTGGASGIGRAAVERFAAEGARICVVDLTEDVGREIAEAVDGSFHRADVGDSEQVDAAFAACERELGGVDIAFLNAGIALGRVELEDLTDEEYRRIMRVNVDGVVFGARAAVRALGHRGGGAIVATASLAGLVPFPPDPIYVLTKHAVVGFIRSIAPTLIERNITANTVNPGMTDTNILTADAKAKFDQAGFPLIPPEQIADAVVQLATSGRTGECWVCQPGREHIAYEFRSVPGPRATGAVGARPPDVTGTW
ncbi:MAG TPA: SDR family oxidoreductase [Acidimicrobiia bacterium]